MLHYSELFSLLNFEPVSEKSTQILGQKIDREFLFRCVMSCPPGGSEPSTADVVASMDNQEIDRAILATREVTVVHLKKNLDKNFFRKFQIVDFRVF